MECAPFLAFFKFYKWYQIVQCITINNETPIFSIWIISKQLCPQVAKNLFNPFVHSETFLYALKTSETCFQGVEKGCSRKKWVKKCQKHQKNPKKQILQNLSYISLAKPHFHLKTANTSQQIFPSDIIDATLMQNLINCHVKNS